MSSTSFERGKGMEELRTKILDYIEDNARVSTKELAVLIGEDEAAVEEEISRMEKENIICGRYTQHTSWVPPCI